ncbi:hypothetical protein [Halorarius halobius]|uniref:hypothetical protein n=1 Tax=Halorarius halobius TaxID=2962671 RepID=UPI0020CD591F|nr:hypothetical protein [Halorarius halobius]
MPDELTAALRPVFLEPRDDYWEIHDPTDVAMDDQRRYQLAPLATAERLETAVYCADCFPDAADDSDRER